MTAIVELRTDDDFGVPNFESAFLKSPVASLALSVNVSSALRTVVGSLELDVACSAVVAAAIELKNGASAAQIDAA